GGPDADGFARGPSAGGSGGPSGHRAAAAPGPRLRRPLLGKRENARFRQRRRQGLGLGPAHWARAGPLPRPGELWPARAPLGDRLARREDRRDPRPSVPLLGRREGRRTALVSRPAGGP